MPRTARMISDNGVYHVFNRGHNKRITFHDPMDNWMFKKLIKRYLVIFEVEIYNYVVTPNHFHFLLRVVSSKDLPKFMKRLCQTYAQYHHRKYNFVGALFQNRYKSLFIKDDSYLLECARYIERNPLRAKLVTDLDDHPYSSYHYYAKGRPDNILTSNPQYIAMAKKTFARRKAYIPYINTPRPYEEILDKKL